MNRYQKQLSALFGDEQVFRNDWTVEMRGHLSPSRRAAPKTPLYMIGRTDAVDISIVSQQPGVRITAKVESRNLFGSIKDRVALQMVGEAIWDESLVPGMTLLEATSGNTGTALAGLGRIIGIPVKLIVPEAVSRVKRQQMEDFGAEVTVVKGHTTEIAREVAWDLSEQQPMDYFLADQYSNRANMRAHFFSTAPELMRQCQRMTHVVAAQGSFGTLGGVAARFQHERLEVEMHAVVAKPGEQTIFGIKEVDDVAPLVNDEVLSGRHLIDGLAALQGRRRALDCGLSVGPSSGAVLAAAIDLSAKVVPGSHLVCILPDGGEKYDKLETVGASATEIDHEVFLNW